MEKTMTSSKLKSRTLIVSGMIVGGLLSAGVTSYFSAAHPAPDAPPAAQQESRKVLFWSRNRSSPARAGRDPSACRSAPGSPAQSLSPRREGIYFNHDPDYIMRMADEAAALGVERFIIDDGWFKGRNDDFAFLPAADFACQWQEGLFLFPFLHSQLMT
jgi:hypothetical protein